MDLLAALILIAVILAVIWGLIKLVMMFIIALVAYLCVCAIIDLLKKAFWT